MASWETYDYLPSRPHDPSSSSHATRRTRNDSTLDPDYHGSKYDPSSYMYLPSRSRSHAPKSRDQSRMAKRWPPSPSVEEEAESLSKEVNPDVTLQDQVPSRGTVDQDQVLIDVPDHIQDRRYVWVPSTRKPTKPQPTPPTSDDDRSRPRDKSRGSKLETAGLPEMRREASPYAYSKPTRSTQTPFKAAEDIFLSPDCMTPPITSYTPGPVKPSSTNNPNQGRSEPDSYFQKFASAEAPPRRSASEHLFEGMGAAEPLRGTEHANNRRAPSRYSWAKAEYGNDVSQHSSPSTPYTTSVPELPRRRPGSSEGFPSDYPVRKPALPQVATVQQSEGMLPRLRQPSDSIQAPHEPTPPLVSQSRTSSSDRLRDALPPSLPSSRPSSRGTPYQTSPLSSPRIQHPASEYPWGAPVTSTAARRPQPPSRLAESSVPKSPFPQPSVSSPSVYSSLPYPLDDHVYQNMPEEKDHQYFPEQPPIRLKSPLPPKEPVSRVGTPKRPSLSARPSAVDVSPTSAGASRPGPSDSPSTMRSSAPTMLPVCSRTGFSTKHSDWYTLEGCLNFDICPYCLETVFGGTPYRAFFKPSPPRPSNMPRKCEFSDPWIRLAWLLTSQRRLPTLNMIACLAKISETEEPCPGRHEGMRSWYSIRDRDGHFVREFTVCPQDLKRLEALFPAFRGLFLPLPTRISYSNEYENLTKYCALRVEMNSRFAIYLDCLVYLHEAAVSSQRLPDAYDFVSLVRRKASIPECRRDDKQKGASWHTIPSIAPAMTVCPDCFDEVVVPHLQSDSDVAMRFNRSAQAVRGEGRLGLSCQLYSSRMRKIFRRAVEDNDMKYLARKAKDRKEVEDGLQDRCAQIKRDSEKLKGRSGYASSSKAQQELDRLQDELEVIGEEWSKWE